MPIDPARPLPGAVLYGVAYYPEYHVEDRLGDDLDLMAAAHLNVIRVGESVWSTWEPRNGSFDLDWLAPTLDGAHRRGIRVVLGTPTYAVPPWLRTAHPEIAGERGTGQRIPWGARQEVDYTNPTFLFHAERVIRAVLGRYAQHPAVIGYQVDNEPGLELFHNEAVFVGFRNWLRARYGDVATLNREWGLTYWSHRLDDWSELWRPDGNTFPQYDLAWRRFQAERTTEFIAWQAALVAEYRRPEQFVTTCLQYPRRGVDDQQLFERLDITAGNPYYGMQDHLDPAVDRRAPNYWTTTGVAGLLRQADRMWSSKQARYLVTETNAQAIGSAETNFPPYPGQLRQAAFAFLSRGAAMIEYWHWHTLPYGTETYWGGVLPHSLRPGRVYAEVAEIGAELAGLGGLLDGYEPDADLAVLWSNPSRYAMQYMPPFARDGEPDPESYESVIDAWYRGVVDAGRQARILHPPQALAIGGAELARRFPVLIAAAWYVTTDDDLELLRDYVGHGGHLVLGVRTAYADHEARVRVATAPAGLTDLAGVRYEEFSNLERDVRVVAVDHDAFDPGPAASARRWVDGLLPEGAEVLARYEHPRFADFAAVTSHPTGSGRVTVVGCVPDPELARAVVGWACPTGRTDGLLADRPVAAPLTISSGTLPDGRSVRFLFNWGWDKCETTLAVPVTDPVSGEDLDPGDRLAMGGWAVRVLADRAGPDPAGPDPAAPDPATPDPATPDPATPDPVRPSAQGRPR